MTVHNFSFSKHKSNSSQLAVYYSLWEKEKKKEKEKKLTEKKLDFFCNNGILSFD